MVESEDYGDSIDAIAEIERSGTPGDVIRELNDELVVARRKLNILTRFRDEFEAESNRLRAMLDEVSESDGVRMPLKLRERVQKVLGSKT